MIIITNVILICVMKKNNKFIFVFRPRFQIALSTGSGSNLLRLSRNVTFDTTRTPLPSAVSVDERARGESDKRASVVRVGANYSSITGRGVGEHHSGGRFLTDGYCVAFIIAGWEIRFLTGPIRR